MISKFRLPTVFLIVCQWLSCTRSPFSDLAPAWLPKAEGIVIDGNIGDWENKGIILPLVADGIGNSDDTGFSARLHLAWDETYFYLMAEVEDDSIVVDTNLPLWKNDGIEIFLSDKKGTDNMVQYLILPPFAAKNVSGQVNRMDYRNGNTTIDVEDLRIRTTLTAEGYIAEIAVPFSALGFRKILGDTLAVNFYLLDNDGAGKSVKYSWHYNDNTYHNHEALYPLRLTTEKPANLALGRAWLEDTTFYHVQLFTEAAVNADDLYLCAGDTRLDTARFEECINGRVARFRFHKSLLPTQDMELTAVSDGRVVATFRTIDIPLVYKLLPLPNAFEPDIQLFEKQDRIKFPTKGAILFVGSSSIRLWKTLETDFTGFQVINRGFGGSKTTDILHFFDRIVTPYQPKVIIYYTGTNDLASGSDAATVANNVEKFVQRVGKTLPGTKILVLNNTIAVSRKALHHEFRKANNLLKQKLANYSYACYVDVNSTIMGEDGMPRPEMFVADSTHLNPQGYKAWVSVVKPTLEKVASKN